MIYLDWNATTPPLVEVVDAMGRVALEAFGNPSSVHQAGRDAVMHLEAARRSVGRLVAAHPRDVVLTGGGTEANNLALNHLLAAARASDRRGTLFLSRLEHPSVWRPAERLSRLGVEVYWLGAQPDGTVDASELASALAATHAERSARGPAMISLQAVNHETGVRQPIADVAALAEEHEVWLHVDAVQAVGKVERFWPQVDLLTIAAHKIRGPKGIGALVSTPRFKVLPNLLGGEQEMGVRPGTQSPALAAGFALAADHAVAQASRHAELASLRDRLETGLIEVAARLGGQALRNGSDDRLAHVSNLSFMHWRGAELCAALDLEGVSVSSGAACSAGSATPSPVITAMHDERRASSAVRCSLGETTTSDDIDEALAIATKVLSRARKTT